MKSLDRRDRNVDFEFSQLMPYIKGCGHQRGYLEGFGPNNKRVPRLINLLGFFSNSDNKRFQVRGHE